MGTLQSSGSVLFSDLQTQLGGTNPISLSEYYLGSTYVPTTGTNYEPAGGTTYYTNTSYYVRDIYNGYNTTGGYYWAGTRVGGASTSLNLSSLTTGGWTYYKGPTVWQSYIYYDYGDTGYKDYGIRRQQTVSINTSVPASGTISLSQFYGARNP